MLPNFTRVGNEMKVTRKKGFFGVGRQVSFRGIKLILIKVVELRT